MHRKNSYDKKTTVLSSKTLASLSKRPMTSLRKTAAKRQNSWKLQQKLPQPPNTERRTLLGSFPDIKNEKNLKSNYFNQLLSAPQLLSQFQIMSHIGRGAFSVVHLAIDKYTGQPFAIKAYEKIDSLDWYRLHNLKRQISNLQNLRHPNVISLQYVVKDRQKIYLVLQNGGKQSLAGLLRKHKKFTQSQAKNYLKQLLSGVAYCHEKGICHRDLKLENILVDDDGTVKIIDFGFSHKGNKKLNSYCGTPPYMSPEIVKKTPHNGSHSDIWAIGIISFLMLFGLFPFRAGNEQQLYRLIQQGKYQLKGEVTVSAKSFLTRMLDVNSQTRATASQLLSHKWLN